MAEWESDEAIPMRRLHLRHPQAIPAGRRLLWSERQLSVYQEDASFEQ